MEMKKIIIQIYEVQEPKEAENLIKIGVDHIGSVVLSKEDWKIKALKVTIDLVKNNDAKSSLIPLFSDLDSICRVLEYYEPDIIHFCEALTWGIDSWESGDLLDADLRNCEALVNQQEKIRRKFPDVQIMRSIPIPVHQTPGIQLVFKLSRMFEPVSDYFLTDTLILNKNTSDNSEKIDDIQPVNGFIGITGKTCDWDIASDLVKHSNIPVILAGGVSPGNVFDGIMQTYPAGVDSCTGTNVIDKNGLPVRFKKDFEKVRKFVSTVRMSEKQIKW